jgi:hypothetical protein
MAACSISGCDNKLRSRGLCSSHWKINKKYGTPTPICWCGEPAQTFAGNKGASVFCKEHALLNRFWGYVDVKSDEECWLWVGSKTTAGYGVMLWDGVEKYAHRISLELDGRPVPFRWHACHTCDTPSCVNPKHLFPGTPRDNVQDMVSKKRHHYGERAYNARLSNGDVRSIRQMAEDGIFLTDIAELFGVTAGYISEILSNRKRQLG